MSSSQLSSNILGEFLVCVHTVGGDQPAIRRVSIVNGVEVVTFVGEDGAAITPTPTDWTPGACPPVPQTASIIENCDGVPAESITYGSNLLPNGDFEQSTGVGASSVAGPDWTTTYTVPVGGNLFAGAGAGAATWAYFTTNAGQVTGNHPNAVPIQALGAQSMAVNVGPNTTIPIISWSNVYLENGQEYELSVDAAMIIGPFAIAIRIDGNLITPVTAPTTTSTWERTLTGFTWTGTSGYHTVSLNSNSGVAGGNDHTFDNISLYTVTRAQTGQRTDVDYNDTVRSVIEQVVETAGCNDDRRDLILSDISDALRGGASAVTLDAHAVAIGGVGAVAQTVSALLPASKRWVSISFTVITGTAQVTDFDGTVTNNLPAGFSLRWDAPADGFLNPPRTITADANSRVVISFTVKS